MDEADFFRVWDGLEVEFDASTLPQNGPLVNFVRASSTQTDTYNIQLNLVGAPQSAPITVNFEPTSESTAVAGVHFQLPSTSIVIPAGENVVNVPVTVLTGNIDPSETPNLVLRITSASNNVAVSANYSQVTVRIRVICPSELAGAYTALHQVLRVGDGSGGASQTVNNVNFENIVNLTRTSAGLYRVDDISFGLYEAVYELASPAGSILDNCNVITGLQSNADQFGDPFIISGVVNADGSLLLEWGNTWGDGGTVLLRRQ
ncbi:hypothetical protein GCM10008106_15870 [Mongoliitalea lutea]|uniref:Calx-beta domain-containing protein n=2 Tax=Mongoliitalea lutea TaxID=849756 RepID=A0A8J3G537_9BACT|nr:hypothetical protein GCM10008106_15870 [Mongoliitalea lutea]